MDEIIERNHGEERLTPDFVDVHSAGPEENTTLSSQWLSQEDGFDRAGPEQNFLNCTVWQCFASIILIWLLMIFLSIWNVPSTQIEWPDPSTFDRASRIVKLPKVPRSKIPKSAAKLWGEAYGKSINLSVEPCDNFFRYVCDGYLDSLLSKAGDFTSTTIMSMKRIELALRSIFLERIKEIRELVHDESKTEELRDSEYEVYKYFESCVDSGSAENFAYSRETFRKLFEDLGIDWFDDPSVNKSLRNVYGLLRATLVYGLHLPEEIFTLTPHLNRHSGHLMMSTAAFFPFDLVAKPQTARRFNRNDRFNIFVDSVWDRVASIAESIADSMKPFIHSENMRDSLELLGFPEFNDTMRGRISIHYDMIYALFLFLRNSRTSCESNIDEWKLDELKKATGEDLVAILTDLIGDFNAPDGKTTLLTCTMTAIAALKLYKDEAAIPVFHDYMALNLLLDVRKLMGGIPVRASCFEKVCQKFDEEYCLLTTRDTLPQSYLSMMQRLLTSDYTRLKMRYLIAIIKLGYAKVLNRQTWIDPDTKLRFLKKTAAMTDHLGSPSHLDRYETTESFTVLTSNIFENKLRTARATLEPRISDLLRPAVRDRHHWPVFAALGAKPEVNAYHVMALNTLIASSSMLVFPFYDETLDIEQLLAAIGFVLAHEIGHGFDLRGSGHGPDGTPMRMWSYEAELEFTERTSCLMSVFDMENPFQDGQILQSGDIIYETASDHTAFQVLFEAWEEETSGKNPSLPGVSCLKPKQLFFFSLVYPLCSALKLSEFRAYFNRTRLSHPLLAFRVNKGLSHTPAFLEAFECTAKNKLFPEAPCRIFD